MKELKMKSFLICANWKMNKNPEEARSYLRQIKSWVKPEEQKHFVFFVPALTAFVLQEELKNTDFAWGAQNCHFENKGAFTGENSPLVLKQMGAGFCLVGHSERRKLFKETNEEVTKKTQALLENNLQPVVCVGETEEERKNGQAFSVVEKQLSPLFDLSFSAPLYMAYEPVWAIGSGHVPKAEDISKMQQHIQQRAEAKGKKIHFLYGGSVDPQNIKTFSHVPKVEGFLVGGASLSAEKFFNLFFLLKEIK